MPPRPKASQMLRIRFGLPRIPEDDQVVGAFSRERIVSGRRDLP
jgi:hypothetical protein